MGLLEEYGLKEYLGIQCRQCKLRYIIVDLYRDFSKPKMRLVARVMCPNMCPGEESIDYYYPINRDIKF